MTEDEEDPASADLVTRLEAAEAVCRADEARRTHERTEAHHRLRNMFSVIRSLARRSADGVETAEEYCALLDGRLAAFFSAQSTIAVSRDGSVDLASVVTDQLLRFGKYPVDERVAGPSTRINGRAAGFIALILHELCSMSLSIHDECCLVVGWTAGEVDHEMTITISAPDSGHVNAGDNHREWLAWLEEAVEYELGGRASIEDDNDDLYCVRIPAQWYARP